MSAGVIIAAALHVVVAAVIVGIWKSPLAGFVVLLLGLITLIAAGLGYVLWVVRGEPDVNGDPERDAREE